MGFLLSFYKEIQDYEDFIYISKGEYLQELNDILERFSIQEVFTDGEQIQQLLDKMADLMGFDGNCCLPNERKRSKSTHTCRENFNNSSH